MLKNTLFILTAIASLAIAPRIQAQIPNTWTRERLIQFYGFRGVEVEYQGSQIKSISFIKQDPHNFHGGECYSLILGVLRGPGGNIDADDNGVKGITVTDSGDGSNFIWHDSVTGCEISSGGKDGFHYTVTRDGSMVLTASLIFGQYSSEFKLKVR